MGRNCHIVTDPAILTPRFPLELSLIRAGHAVQDTTHERRLLPGTSLALGSSQDGDSADTLEFLVNRVESGSNTLSGSSEYAFIQYGCGSAQAEKVAWSCIRPELGEHWAHEMPSMGGGARDLRLLVSGS